MTAKEKEEKSNKQFTEDLAKQIKSIVHTFGALLFTPVILLIAVGYGLRAGLVVTVEKTLEMLKQFEG